MREPMIRRMTAHDLPAVVSIVEENHPGLGNVASQEIGQAFPETPSAPHGEFLVAELDEQVVGMVGWVSDPWQVHDVRWLVWGYVHPDVHRRGIATALFDTAEEAIRDAGCRKVYLDVGNPEAHRSAIAFHESRGFRVEGHLRDFWEDGEDFLVYGKRLSATGSA